QPRAIARRIVADPVTLADIPPTAARLLGVDAAELKTVDGIDLSPALGGQTLPNRELYAESFAPLIEFGWAPLRSIRSGPWKYIAAPRSELYDLERDAGEQTNLISTQENVARGLDARITRYSSDALPAFDLAGIQRGGGRGASELNKDAAERL